MAAGKKGGRRLTAPRAGLLQLVAAVETIYAAIGTGRTSVDALAELLGYTNASNGSFQAVVAGLRRGQLIEGRGDLRLTERGVLLAESPPDQAQRMRAEVFLADPFWSQFAERYDGDELPGEADLGADIAGWLGIPVQRARAVGAQAVESATAAGLVRSDGRLMTAEEPPSSAQPGWLDDTHVRLVIEEGARMLPPAADGWTEEALGRWLEWVGHGLRFVYRVPVSQGAEGEGGTM